ncbi:MAG: DUF2796 domain-containing protein [Helicobacteraceae bacterium]|jgi:hypothetical protein|nr:DUF2796 domain-containing protein [Helicobacteraceae bacterium]
MNRGFAPILSAMLGLAATTFYAADAHEHGAAKMNLSIDDQEVLIELETPLDNTLGFERAPKDAEEEKAVKEMAAKLKSADALFVFPPKAECKLVSVELESEALDANLLGEKTKAKHDDDHEEYADHDDEGHADLDARYIFSCANVKALNQIAVDFFKVFPKTNEIEAQIVTAKGQSAAELSAKRNTITIAQ